MTYTTDDDNEMIVPQDIMDGMQEATGAVPSSKVLSADQMAGILIYSIDKGSHLEVAMNGSKVIVNYRMEDDGWAAHERASFPRFQHYTPVLAYIIAILDFDQELANS